MKVVRRSHYTDVIMAMMAVQITSLTVVFSTVDSDADQSKHQSSASVAFVRGIHWDRWIPRTKGQLRGKCFHLMTSSWATLHEIYGCPIFNWIAGPWQGWKCAGIMITAMVVRRHALLQHFCNKVNYSITVTVDSPCGEVREIGGHVPDQ